MALTYEPIATTTLGAAAASITFSSIPSTYTDLVLTIVTPTGTGDFLELRFNGATTGYSWTYVGGDGTSAVSGRLSSAGGVRVSPTMGSATLPTFANVSIFSYAGSTNKTILSQGVNDLNGSGWVRNYVGLWSSTAAINSVLIRGDSGLNLAIGTTATIYGIKSF